MMTMILFCAEKLRRIDDLITSKLAEKQQIICNMFRVPMEDFNTIVDIASQPEAPQVSENGFRWSSDMIWFEVFCLFDSWMGDLVLRV